MLEKMYTGTNEWISSLIPWLISSGFRIVIIAVASLIFFFIAKRIIVKVVKMLVVPDLEEQDKRGEEQREKTLIQIFTLSLKIVLAVISILMIASEFGMEIGPILASAGVVGLALGFGGQYLIRDLISGLFIIIENQYRMGDFIETADKSGQVERISLRMTTLRDLDGDLHYIPHGEIKTVTNLSKKFSRINLNIGVGYGSDINKVISIVNKVGKELTDDKEWSTSILSAPKFLRVDDLGDSAVVIKVIGDTKPSQQWAVAGEMRKRLYEAFNESDIEIPFPQRTVHVVNSKELIASENSN